MSSKRLEKEFLAAYEAYADALFRHCYFRVYSRERAREVVQETFMRAWDYVSKGNRVDNMRAFLYQVATNLIIDESRRRKGRASEVSLELLFEERGFDPPSGSGGEIESRIEGAMVLGVLRDLDQKYREAVFMRYVDDLTPREIAEITGESENVVSVRIHRGLKQLRRLLERRKSDETPR